MFSVKCSEISSKEYFDFIKKPHDTDENPSKSTQHYMNYFEEYKSSHRIMHWNWSAGFLTTPWMLYRKMYLVFFMTLLLLDAHFVVAKPFMSAQSFSLLTMIWFIVGIIVSGFFADYIYLVFAVHKIKKGISHRGVSLKAPIIFIIALLFLLTAMPFILFALMLYFPSLVPTISALISIYSPA
jgi:hypothetical protein